MRNSSGIWLAATVVMIISIPKSYSAKGIKAARPQFVRGHDDDWNPGKAGIFPIRAVSADSPTQNEISEFQTTTASSNILKNHFTSTSHTMNGPGTNKPRFKFGKSLPLPPIKFTISTTSNTTQYNNIETSASNRTETITNQVIKRRRLNPDEISQKINPYQCGDKKKSYRLCGYPMFYRSSDCGNIFCDDLPLKHCENTAGMIAFVTVTIILGALIVAANCLLPCIVARRRVMRNNHNYIKVSLSFADMICGLVLVSTILPNILKLQNISEREFAASVLQSNSDTTSTVAGALLALSLEASLLHLLFLSIERYLAILWSVKRDSLKKRTVIIILILIWAVSTLVSVIPVIFPDDFGYRMLPVLFLSFPAATPNGDDSVSNKLNIYVCLVMLLPYAIMVFVCFLTWFSVRWRRMKDRDFRSETVDLQIPSKGILDRIRMFTQGIIQPSPEMIVFKTLLIMVAAFSITLLPLMVVAIQYASGYYNCDNYALPYTLSFYASISNSFVNVLIYAVRDKHFRKAICSKIRRRQGSSGDDQRQRKEIHTSTDL